jgi:hypothetical protein
MHRTFPALNRSRLGLAAALIGALYLAASIGANRPGIMKDVRRAARHAVPQKVVDDWVDNPRENTQTIEQATQEEVDRWVQLSKCEASQFCDPNSPARSWSWEAYYMAFWWSIAKVTPIYLAFILLCYSAGRFALHGGCFSSVGRSCASDNPVCDRSLVYTLAPLSARAITSAPISDKPSIEGGQSSPWYLI